MSEHPVAGRPGQPDPLGQCQECGVMTHDYAGHYSRCQARGLSLFDRLTHASAAIRQGAARSLNLKPRRDRSGGATSRRGLS